MKSKLQNAAAISFTFLTRVRIQPLVGHPVEFPIPCKEALAEFNNDWVGFVASYEGVTRKVVNQYFKTCGRHLCEAKPPSAKCNQFASGFLTFDKYVEGFGRSWKCRKCKNL